MQYKTVKDTKNTWCLVLNLPKILNYLRSQPQKHRESFSLSKSLRAKYLTLSVYHIPKWFHMSLLTTVKLETFSNCQDLFNAELKLSNRLDTKKEVLYHPI